MSRKGQMIMEKLRIGLVGCGKMMVAHAQAVNKVEDVEIVAVCDVIYDNAKAVADALGNNPYITSDYTDMLDYIDAVLIALPHDLHYECGMFFAHHKKHILMEKPLCNSEEECVNLIEKCEAEGVTLMCGYPVRFWPGIVKLKELVDSGEYGAIMQMSIWTEQLTGIDYIKDDGTRNWTLTARIGGGQLFSHGCHYIDVMLWFLGEPLFGTHIGTKAGTPWMLGEGTSVVTLKFKNGAIGYHGATWGARGTRLGSDFQIQTEKGLLEYERASGEVRIYNRNQIHNPDKIDAVMPYTVLWRRDGENNKETQHEIRHFAECVRTGKKPLTDGRSALQSLRVIWALYNAENNNAVANLRGLGLENI